MYAYKKSGSGRQARSLLKPRGQKKKPLTLREKFELADVIERHLEDRVGDFITRPYPGDDVLEGSTQEERIRREKWITAMTNSYKVYQWKMGSWGKNPLEMLQDRDFTKTHMGPRSWKAEIKLKEGELAVLVAKDLEAQNYNVNWENYLERRVQSSRRAEAVAKLRTVDALKAQEVKEWFDRGVEIERPAILKYPVVLPKKEAKVKITKVSDPFPFAFETSHYPLEAHIYGPFRTRKVALRIKLSKLHLPKLVRTRLLQIAGHLYDEPSDTLVVKYSKKHTLQENRKAVSDLARKILHEAWKADLSFVHTKEERRLPHDVVAEEVSKAPQREEEARLSSFENIIQNASRLSVFRILTFPNVASEEKGREKVTKLILYQFPCKH
eukprot:TRINITY_DN8752_c0_g1_i9.p1 TRINITY_DN8752_c0_g1~~TRINITY_DN8752_c0_g1_i9.p1  ORF type:complete len:383 (+),score=54.15 TRINITY_DN8752_c0_g1_i9:833-1981(+)